MNILNSSARPGAQGPEGVQGPQGFQGPQGSIGAQGVKGVQGRQGFQGVPGPQGQSGLTGAQGSQGQTGLTGAQGQTGSTGAQGSQGQAGLTGTQGHTGLTGAQGQTGLTGVQGVPGIQGAQGATGKSPTDSMIVVCSDEVTPLTAGPAQITWRMPYAFTLASVRASLTTAQISGNSFTVDVKQAGVSVLSTKVTIDNTELTSQLAAVPSVVSVPSLVDDAQMTIDIVQIGDGTATGLKVCLIGHQ